MRFRPVDRLVANNTHSPVNPSARRPYTHRGQSIRLAFLGIIALTPFELKSRPIISSNQVISFRWNMLTITMIWQDL